MPTNGKIVLSESGFYLNGKKCSPGTYEVDVGTRCEQVITVRNEGDDGELTIEVWYKVDDKPWSEWTIGHYYLRRGEKATKKTATTFKSRSAGKTYRFKWIVRDKETGRVTDEYGC